MIDAVAELERGRAFVARRAWLDAHTSLSGADEAAPLPAVDVELLATSAYMLGREQEYLVALERAHRLHLDAGDVARAVRCAFWIGLALTVRGELGRANGWLVRAQRLVEGEPPDSVERGYLLLPEVLRLAALGDPAGAYATAADAAALAERHGERDLLALAVHEQGHALLDQGQVEEGLSLLDEAMVAVTAGELSPIVTGLLYCSVIGYCQEVYALRRSQEWTAALTHWWEEQPDMVAFSGVCLVHRAELMQLHGTWHEALEEARRAGRRLAVGANQIPVGLASYRQGEVHRLQGELAAAEEAYREASDRGWEPQPGLALLRLARGDKDAAGVAIRRVLGEATALSRRAALLPAYIEIMLATADTEAARTACRELEEISDGYRSVMLAATAAHARGAVALADGDAWAALVALRHAFRVWQELGAPYEGARARVLVGLACRQLGDGEGAELELDAALRVFRELGAQPDLARTAELSRTAGPASPNGLTTRERQVLGLVAKGRTNRAIAAELVISEKTVARHVSNIFTKLRVSSRSAATAYAYEHDLV